MKSKKFILLSEGDNYVLREKNKATILLELPRNIYDIDLAKQVAINFVRNLKQNITLLYFQEHLDVPRCNQCDGKNVEFKGWLNQLTGSTETVDSGDNGDTYCNECGGHKGVYYSRLKKPMIIYQNVVTNSNPVS